MIPRPIRLKRPASCTSSTDRGVEIVVLQDARCIELMRRFIAARPALWNEDIGE